MKFQFVIGAQSRYFELFGPHKKLPLNGRKLENNSLIREKDRKIEKDKDGKGWRRLTRIANEFEN